MGRCAIYACNSEQFTESESADTGDLLLLAEDPAGAAGQGAGQVAPGAGDPRSDASRTGTTPGTPATPSQLPVRLPAGRATRGVPTGAAPSSLPVPRSERPPAVIDGDPIAALAQSKRAAFRYWLRELLDEGLRVPRLWTSIPVVQRRMRLPEQEHEETTRFETRLLVRILLALLVPVLLLVLAGNPTWWVAFELAGYLALTGALHAMTQPFHRELIVDSNQELMVKLVGPSVPRRPVPVCNLRQAAAVALLVESDPKSGLAAGVVLLDFDRRPIAVPGLWLPARRDGAPTDEDVRCARATARFLGLTFAGAVDARGRRRRLPAPDGTAPGF